MSVIKQDVEEYNLKVIKSLFYVTNYSLRIVNFSLVLFSITVPDEATVIRYKFVLNQIHSFCSSIFISELIHSFLYIPLLSILCWSQIINSNKIHHWKLNYSWAWWRNFTWHVKRWYVWSQNIARSKWYWGICNLY